MKSKIKAFGSGLLSCLPFAAVSIFFCLCVFLIGRLESYTVTQKSVELPTQKMSADTMSESIETEEPAVPLITDTRRVAEHEGDLGIFDCFGNLVGRFYTDLSVLPSQDRKLLSEGIVFDNEAEMRDFLESLDS